MQDPNEETSLSNVAADDVISYWLGNFGAVSKPGQEWEYRGGLWWSLVDPSLRTPDSTVEKLGEDTVRHIGQRFSVAKLIAASVDEEKVALQQDSPLAHWVAEGIRGKVAAVIALTQFTRATLGFTRQTVVCCSVAENIALNALAENQTVTPGTDRTESSVPWSFCLFLLLALLQSDNANTIKQAVDGIKLLKAEMLKSGSEYQKKVAGKIEAVAQKSAILRLNAVARFGRNPHLNAVLARESTAEEEEYVKQIPLPKWEFTAGCVLRSQTRRTRRERRAAAAGSEQQLSSAEHASPHVSAQPQAPKLRILVLHGLKQSASFFAKRARKHLAALAALAELDFLDAPHPYSASDAAAEAEDDAAQDGVRKAWFNVRDKDGTVEYEGLHSTVRYVDEYAKHHGPFDGVLGFSQGGCLAAILAAIAAKTPRPVPNDGSAEPVAIDGSPDAASSGILQLHSLRPAFAIIISAPFPRLGPLPLGHNASFKFDFTGKGPDIIPLPSFHIWGDRDPLVTPDLSRALANLFQDPRTATHAAPSHFAGALKDWPGPLNLVAQWLKERFPSLASEASHGASEAAQVASAQGAGAVSRSEPFLSRIEQQLTSQGFDVKEHRFVVPIGCDKAYPRLQLPALKCPRLYRSSFCSSLLAAGQTALLDPHAAGLQWADAEQFVQEAMAGEGKDEDEDEGCAAEDVAVLAAALFPMRVTQRTQLEQEKSGQVGLWLWMALYKALHETETRGAEFRPLLEAWLDATGDWSPLQRLDLLAVTGSAVRQAVLASEKGEDKGCACQVTWEADKPRYDSMHAFIVRTLAERLVQDYRKALPLASALGTRDPALNAARRDQLELPSRAATKAPRIGLASDKVTRIATHVAAEIAISIHKEGEVVFTEGDLLRLPLATPISSATKAFLSRIYKQVLAPSMQVLSSPLMDDQRRFREEGAERREWKSKTGSSASGSVRAGTNLKRDGPGAHASGPGGANLKGDPDSEETVRLRVEEQARELTAQLEELLEEPPSTRVLFPEPEPVDIASAAEFAPLHDFLRKRGAGGAAPVGDAPVGDEELHFQRGALCGDGRLDLCKQVIGPSGIESLMESLALDSVTRRAVNSVLLGNNIAGNDLGQAVADMIAGKRVLREEGDGTTRVQPAVKVWYIAGNRLTADGLRPVLEALQTDDFVTQLWLKRNPLGSSVGVDLASMLQRNTCLQVLDLTNCALLDHGLDLLCPGMRANSTLQHLYLGANGITVVGARKLAQVIKEGECNLSGLLLASNRLGDEGVRVLCEALEQAPKNTITRLDFSSCGVGPLGAKHISQLLLSANGCKLRHLGLGFDKTTAPLRAVPNRLGAAGVGYLAEAFRNARPESELYSVILTHTAGWAADHGAEGRGGLGRQALKKLWEGVCRPGKGTLISFGVELGGNSFSELMRQDIQATLALNRSELSEAQLAAAEEARSPAHLAQVQSVYRVGGVYPDA
mmetsp:Transcript_47862/g.112999  ORF Transcript_47862/g.112999 Transcript_47862/m.112999 type:complete len:1463 (+) Transcript_47862:116-4504(+)